MSKQCIFCGQETQYKVDRTGNLRMYFNCAGDGFYAITQPSYARVEIPSKCVRKGDIKRYNESKKIPLLNGIPITITEVVDIDDLIDYWERKLYFVCPKCGSTNIMKVLSARKKTEGYHPAKLAEQEYVCSCKDCKNNWNEKFCN